MTRLKQRKAESRNQRKSRLRLFRLWQKFRNDIISGKPKTNECERCIILPQATFLNAFCPLRAQVPLNSMQKNKEPHLRRILCFYGAGVHNVSK